MESSALTRRRLLELTAASLGTAALGACSGGAPPATREGPLPAAPGPTAAPGPPAPGRPTPPDPARLVVLTSGTFSSAYRRGASTGWTVATPTVTAPSGAAPAAGRLPVALYLHGLGGNHRGLFDLLGAEAVLAAHLAAGGPPFALASVDGGNDWWHARTNGTDPQSMLREEFLPLLADRGLDTGTLALAGLSMGGFGALLMASRRALRGVRAVAAMSPALWRDPNDGIEGAFDGPGDFATNDVFALRPGLAGVPKRIDCGTEDELYRSVEDYVSGLPAPLEGGFQPGGHDPAYWRSVLPAVISFLGRHLG